MNNMVRAATPIERKRNVVDGGGNMKIKKIMNK
jgi:hypothetical protein